MRLIRAAEVPETSGDRVFRMSRLYAVLFFLIFLSLCAAMVLRRWPSPTLSYVFSGTLLFFLFLGRRFVTARFHPLNWAVRASDDGLYIHFRSYLNEDMPAEDATVVFLGWGELRQARRVREKVETRNERGAVQTQWLRWVELELAVDPRPLSAALGDENSRPGVTKKRWYGSSATLFRDYPVRMQTPPFLWVRWNLRPSAATFFRMLPGQIEIAPPVKISQDFAGLNGLTRDEQEKRLRQLDERGDRLGAVYAAQHLYSLNLTEATTFIRNLRGEK